MLNFNWLNGVPLNWARASIIMIYILILVAVWFLKNSYIFQGAPDQKWWRNLKLWATVAIATQLFAYLYF